MYASALQKYNVCRYKAASPIDRRVIDCTMTLWAVLIAGQSNAHGENGRTGETIGNPGVQQELGGPEEPDDRIKMVFFGQGGHLNNVVQVYGNDVPSQGFTIHKRSAAATAAHARTLPCSDESNFNERKLGVVRFSLCEAVSERSVFSRRG
jgi:hypothetical protein